MLNKLIICRGCHLSLSLLPLIQFCKTKPFPKLDAFYIFDEFLYLQYDNNRSPFTSFYLYWFLPYSYLPLSFSCLVAFQVILTAFSIFLLLKLKSSVRNLLLSIFTFLCMIWYFLIWLSSINISLDASNLIVSLVFCC